jgi:hypothetical protein
MVLGVAAMLFSTAATTARGDDSAAADQAAALVFEQQIAPILKAYCWKCHGGEARKAGLDLRTLPLALQGGKSGPALVRGNANNSLLVRKILEDQMPPAGELDPTAAHLEILRKWIDSGAHAAYEGGPLTEAESPPISEIDRKSWAFRAPVRSSVPQVHAQELVCTPVDAFLLQKIEVEGLSFSPMAERRTLLRRAALDVLGLPPAPEDVDAFLADESPDAWEQQVERLLANPHYGERWGRHWLDARLCRFMAPTTTPQSSRTTRESEISDTSSLKGDGPTTDFCWNRRRR